MCGPTPATPPRSRLSMMATRAGRACSSPKAGIGSRCNTTRASRSTSSRSIRASTRTCTWSGWPCNVCPDIHGKAPGGVCQATPSGVWNQGRFANLIWRVNLLYLFDVEQIYAFDCSDQTRSGLSSRAYVDHRAADIGGCLRKQPDDRFGRFLRGARPSQGHGGGQALHPSGVTGAGVDVCQDQAWRNGIDPDSLRSGFPGEANRQAVDGAFGGGIPDEFVGAAEIGRP